MTRQGHTQLPMIILTIVMILGMPCIVFASAEPDTPEQPSFYGSRTVSQQNNTEPPPPIHFQRRAIAPPINPSIVKLTTNSNSIARERTNTGSTSTKPKGLDTKKVLNRQDLILANKAKYYIERNWNSDTGLIDSVQGYPHSTMWDIASSLAAFLALDEMQLISSHEASFKIEKILTTLSNIPLYKNTLPNREYNTRTAKPSGKFSGTISNGNGWSALDIGRLLIWLKITSELRPQFKSIINTIVSKWDISSAIHNQTLYGELKTVKNEYYRQEGRLGYLQYAAQGFELFGFDVSEALCKKNTQKVNVNNIELYVDNRNLPFFTTDPYVLGKIELNLGNTWWDQLDELYNLHRQSYDKTKKLWVFAEDSMNRPPWFSYNNIHFYGTQWLSTSSSGKPIENPQVFSNKAAIALSVIYSDHFSFLLMDKVIDNSLGNRSVPTGIYENGAPNLAFNINTNSLALVSLWYKSKGFKPILDISNTNHQVLKR